VSDWVSLKGIGAALGRDVGALLRDDVIGRIEKMDVRDENDQSRRREAFLRMLEPAAPHWIEEARGIGAAVGVPWERIVDLNCLRRRPSPRCHAALPAEGGCTSALAVGDGSRGAGPLLWKNRDEWPHTQFVCHFRQDGKHAFLAGTNVCNLGVAHFLNEHGLAGACNTGSALSDEITDPGLSDCHVMRLIAEHAADCDQALALFEDLLLGHRVGTAGYERGMILLFVDAKQRGLVIEASCRTFDSAWVHDGTVGMANHFVGPRTCAVVNQARMTESPVESSRKRYARINDLLRSKRRGVGVRDLMVFSRDRANRPLAIANDGDLWPWRSLSSFIHVIDPDDPGLSRAWVCNGHPCMAEYLPVYVAAEGVPRAWFASRPPPKADPVIKGVTPGEKSLIMWEKQFHTSLATSASPGLPERLADELGASWQLLRENSL